MSFNSRAEVYGFPTYQSHKIVKAARITQVYSESCVHTDPGGSFTFDPSGKPTPQVGWYVVCYEDGYVSFSPPEAFEKGNTLLVASDPKSAWFSFGEALDVLKRGGRVAREGWNGKGMFLFLVPGSTFTVNRAPLLGIYLEGTVIDYHSHIDMKTAQGYVVPWLASQADMLAEDWTVVTGS